MFQVLEHLDRLDSVFAALRDLTRDEGEAFIAVPNSDRIVVQERLTGFIDMPPVHIGRWTQQGLGDHRWPVRLLVESRLNRRSALTELWEMAKYGLESRTRRRGGLAAGAERISFRPVPGVIKRAAAVGDLVRLAPHYGKIPPVTQWFHLRRVTS